jgi:hypothetical protein
VDDDKRLVNILRTASRLGRGVINREMGIRFGPPASRADILWQLRVVPREEQWRVPHVIQREHRWIVF